MRSILYVGVNPGKPEVAEMRLAISRAAAENAGLLCRDTHIGG